jgi:hypothetical protein
MVAAEEVSQGVPTFVKDLFSGACGGIAQVLIGEFGVFFVCRVEVKSGGKTR